MRKTGAETEEAREASVSWFALPKRLIEEENVNGGTGSTLRVVATQREL